MKPAVRTLLPTSVGQLTSETLRTFYLTQNQVILTKDAELTIRPGAAQATSRIQSFIIHTNNTVENQRTLLR